MMIKMSNCIELDDWISPETARIKEGSVLYRLKKAFVARLLDASILTRTDLENSKNMICELRITNTKNSYSKLLYNITNLKEFDIYKLMIAQDNIYINTGDNGLVFTRYLLVNKANIISVKDKVNSIYDEVIHSLSLET
jgi:hypothetical protein